MPDLVAEGIDLFNRRLYWEAHEAWERAWTPDRNGPERGFFKGLIQVAAGCLHCTRRNRRGTVNKWRGGTGLLRPYLPLHRGVRLRELVDSIESLLAEVEAGGWPAGPLPVIETVEAAPAARSPQE